MLYFIFIIFLFIFLFSIYHCLWLNSEKNFSAKVEEETKVSGEKNYKAFIEIIYTYRGLIIDKERDYILNYDLFDIPPKTFYSFESAKKACIDKIIIEKEKIKMKKCNKIKSKKIITLDGE